MSGSFINNIPTQIISQFIRFKIESTLNLKPIQGMGRLPAPKPGHHYVLYIHVPFCERLCPYCSFNRFIYSEEKARNYFKSLREEFYLIQDLGYQFDSAYIGGGTPTILIDELVKTIDLARQLFSIPEFSCETNPNHLNETIISALEGRVDRLSVGVQSFNDALLRQMNRYEKYGSGSEILERIRRYNHRIPVLNADLIFNFPNQTKENLIEDVNKVIESGVTQCTFYPLMSAPSVEKSLRSLGEFSYDREAEFYEIIDQKLSGIYQPASAWTYTRQGKAMLDEYIVQYEEYVGAGSGSFSYLNGQLFVNTFSLNEYDQRIRSKEFPITATRKFKRLDQMQYRLMMSLFDQSLDMRKFKEDFGLPVEIALFKELAFMKMFGLINRDSNQNLKINPDHRYMLIVMMREFFAGVNSLRDQARQSLTPQERRLCEVEDFKMAYDPPHF